MLKCESMEGTVTATVRRDGDRVKLAGRSGSKKLKQLFQERKLTQPQRAVTPVLRDALDRVGEMNEACVETLIHLLAKTDDSNLVYRGGLEGLEFVRTRAEELLSDDPGDMDAIRELDRECIERNLSPGGCADLLAITIMLHLVVK